MKFGYIVTDVRGAGDITLSALAKRLEMRRLRLAGTVQMNTGPTTEGRCDMDVRVLGGGPVIRISQSLGAGATGCRLNPAALEQAVAEVASRLDDGVDLVLINKFGKHEAEGRGFRPLIADVLERGLPLLIAVNELNLEPFLNFSAGIAQKVPGDPGGLEEWLGSSVQPAAA
jgi:hypothetical protein